MDALERWGWDAAWDERFAAYGRSGLVPGRISVEHREQYHYHGPSGERVAQVSGRLRHLALGRADFPAVGDWVALREPPDVGPAVIEAVLPRVNKLSRKAAGGSGDEQILAANLDVLFLVTSLNLNLNLRRVERFLVAAALPNCLPVVVLTKSDLREDVAAVVEEFRGHLEGVPVHAVCALDGNGLDALTPYLGGARTVAMLGSSGVGKSTLLNRLVGLDRQEVQPVREDDDRGRHTTTHRELVPLPRGGLLIDSPGIRELQLWAEDADADAAFADISRLAEGCSFADCTHTHEPRCAIQQAIEEGELEEARYESFLKLRRELAYEEARTDNRAARERKEQERRIHRIYKTTQKHNRRKGW